MEDYCTVIFMKLFLLGLLGAFVAQTNAYYPYYAPYPPYGYYPQQQPYYPYPAPYPTQAPAPVSKPEPVKTTKSKKQYTRETCPYCNKGGCSFCE